MQAQRNLTFLAALTVVNDSESLQEQLVEVSHEELHFLLQRCSVTTTERLTWKLLYCLLALRALSTRVAGLVSG